MAENPIVRFEIEEQDVDGDRVLAKEALGTIEVELYPEVAPETVNNFVTLVNSGFYNGLTFHRIIEGFMVQGGCPEGTGFGGPGYSIPGEFEDNGFKNDLKHEPGVISMARAMHPDSGGSQFFIMHHAAPYLDGKYAAFGKVISGMDVVNRLAECDISYGDTPKFKEVMTSVTVDTFGVDYPEPKKV